MGQSARADGSRGATLSERRSPARPGRVVALLALLAAGLNMAAAELAAQEAATQEAVAPAATVEPIRTPFLLIDTEMHVAPVTRVGADANGRMIATGSSDKSIRLFDAASGRLLRRIHLPLGDGQIGAVRGLALSPDGSRLVAATVSFDTGNEFDQGSVYLIDTASGQLLGRMQKLPAPPLQLAYSPDGRYLALALGRGGLQIRTASGKPILREIGQAVPAVAFVGDDLLAMTEDGILRRYDLNGETASPDAALTVAGAGLAFSIAPSPDGRRAAIGYENREGVDLVDLASGRVARLSAPEGSSDGNLAAVVWTAADGVDWLVAGGTVQDAQQRNLLVAWRDGTGMPTRLAVSGDSITDMIQAGPGAVAFGSADPAWGRVAVNGAPGALAQTAGRAGERLDFRGSAQRGVAVDATGTAVIFADRDPARPPFRFSLADLTLDSTDTAALHGAAASPPGLPNWHLATALSVAGHAVPLRPGERVLAAAPADRGRLVLGTDSRLRLIGADGVQISDRALSAAAWGVAVAPDRPLLVAALGDGTIRWYSLRDDLPLAELAGLFVHADGRRWVAWTADGLFAHSDLGGEQLVGFQQNGSVKAPTGTWLGLQQTYRLFHDPEAVQRAVADEAGWPEIAGRSRIDRLFADLKLPAVQLAGYCPLPELPLDVATRGLSRRPPAGPEQVDLSTKPVAVPLEPGCSAIPAGSFPLELPEGTRAVRIVLTVTDRGGGPGVVDAFVNGRNGGRTPAEAIAALGTGPAVIERIVPIAGLTTTVSFRAYGAQGIYAESPSLVFHSPDAAKAATAKTLHVLAAGINRYRADIPRLTYAAADARTFVANIRRVTPQAYRTVQVTELYDDEATRDGVIAALRALASQVAPQDSVLVYLAGHGIADEQGYRFITSNVGGLDRLADGLDGGTLLSSLGDIPAANVFVFLDTCQAGAFDIKGPADFAHESGYYVLTAATSLQSALDSYDGRNGVFAHAVAEGLLGGAGASEGDIDALQLGVYVRRVVPKLAASVRPAGAEEQGYEQTAVFKAAAGDFQEFPIAGQEVAAP